MAATAEDSKVEAQTDPTPDSSKMSSCKPSLPFKDQAQSPLLQLPAEIRLMILREVLLSPAPLSERASYEKPCKQWCQPKKEIQPRKKSKRTSLPRKAKEKQKAIVETSDGESEDEAKEVKTKLVAGYNLAPAILRTCQALLIEGWPVLYEGNILKLVYTDHPISFYKRRETPYLSMWAYRNDALLCLRYSYGKAQMRLDEGARDFLLRFKSLLLDCTVHTDKRDKRAGKHFRSGLEILGPIVAGKSIRVMLPPTGRSLFSNEVYLKAFQLLRCKAFAMTGAAYHKIDEVTNTVLSDTEVLNLANASKMLRPVKSHFKYRASPSLREWAEGKISELYAAVLDFDSAKFEEIRAELVAEYDEEQARIKQELYADDTWKN
ncbi:hypothetical protein PMZ80_008992 [Knufia obscura]|uniref:Uncharacterized protein n=2 Tax=Knufia TaxID=430999 RepID=A0AAN8EW78_9EURO|nr:hypothetical protein PMZ80_008992 [Knufia obscura]KAK5955051.1 hypothetical protein OHC33_003730 [Knufia fluminis]